MSVVGFLYWQNLATADTTEELIAIRLAVTETDILREYGVKLLC